MPCFHYKLLGPRPTFPRDITPDERAMMARHVAYWKEFFKDDSLLVFGPVADPRGAYGIAIIAVPTEADARHRADNDPAILAGTGFTYELHPMGAITKNDAVT